MTDLPDGVEDLPFGLQARRRREVDEVGDAGDERRRVEEGEAGEQQKEKAPRDAAILPPIAIRAHAIRAMSPLRSVF